MQGFTVIVMHVLCLRGLNFFAILILSLFMIMESPDVCAKTILVGPNKEIKLPSEAARIAKDGDYIFIMAGEYRRDVATWRQNNITISGANGRPHINSEGFAAQGKAIWVLTGDNIVIRNIEMSGARTSDLNAEAIRLENGKLLLENCLIHNNETGILTGNLSSVEIEINNCEFHHNYIRDPRYLNAENPNRVGHNIYIGRSGKFILRNSYIHHAIRGHNVKSRAALNIIHDNIISDEEEGRSSYLIDLPNAGESYIYSNNLLEGAKSENYVMISYGSENEWHRNRTLYVYNNTAASNSLFKTIFLFNRTDTPVYLHNNTLPGWIINIGMVEKKAPK